MEQVSQNIDEKYNAYHAGLTELIQFLESGNMDAYFAQPTQGMQNALGAALGNTRRSVAICITRPLRKARMTTALRNGRWR
jgi:methyl-accepting chemotaxis protein-2 (aspartate sensor receptor)